MAKKNSVPQRISSRLKADLEIAGTIRVTKGLAKVKEITMPEMTDLLTRTTGYRLSLEELKIKPKRKNLT